MWSSRRLGIADRRRQRSSHGLSFAVTGTPAICGCGSPSGPGKYSSVIRGFTRRLISMLRMFRVGAFMERKSLATIISVKQNVRAFSRASMLSRYLARCQLLNSLASREHTIVCTPKEAKKMLQN